MRLKFYFDEDSADRALVAALRSRGFEAVTPDEIGLLGHEDLTQLEWCAQQGFVLVSHNIGDFYCLHREFLQRGKPIGARREISPARRDFPFIYR